MNPNKRYFARVQPDLTIDQIVVISSENVQGLPFPESEPLGQQFLDGLYGPGSRWLETSKTGQFRGIYARIGGSWSEEDQEFKQPIEEDENVIPDDS